MTRGLYFLANEDTLEHQHLIAFLNSVKMHQPDLALCMIPYNSDIAQVIPLQDRYAFSIYSDTAVLDQCDEISRRFHGYNVGYYRKLAIWEGAFDEFIYMDVDTVLLRSLDGVFDMLNALDFITEFALSGKKWIWKESIVQSQLITMDQFHRGANLGFIASKKGALTIKRALEVLHHSVDRLIPHLVLAGHDMGFLNYLIAKSGLSYSALDELYYKYGKRECGVPFFAGEANARIEAGQIYQDDIPYLYVHWPGPLKDPEHMPYSDLWRYYRDLRYPL